jgi:hypothetical protein
MNQAPNRFSSIDPQVVPIDIPLLNKSHSWASNKDIADNELSSIPDQMSQGLLPSPQLGFNPLISLQNLQMNDIDYQLTQSEEDVPTQKLAIPADVGSFQNSDIKLYLDEPEDIKFDLNQEKPRFISPVFTQSASQDKPLVVNRFLAVSQETENPKNDSNKISRADSMPVVFQGLDANKVSNFFIDHVKMDDISFDSNEKEPQVINLGRFTIEDKTPKGAVEERDNEDSMSVKKYESIQEAESKQIQN